MNQKLTEQKSASFRRILTVAIAMLAVFAVVVGCLMLSSCNGKKKPATSDDPSGSGTSSPQEGGEVDADDERLQRIDTSKSFEAAIFAAYYRYCAQSKCRFVREWAEADRNLRNITAALTARQRGLNIADVVDFQIIPFERM